MYRNLYDCGYNGHLAHGHTWKLRKKVMGSYVLTHASKNESEVDDVKIEMLEQWL